MQALNITALTSPTTRAAINAALIEAATDSLHYNVGYAYINNRKGNPYLRVKHTRNTTKAFTFHGVNNQDLTETVLKTLKGA